MLSHYTDCPQFSLHLPFQPDVSSKTEQDTPTIVRTESLAVIHFLCLFDVRQETTIALLGIFLLKVDKKIQKTKDNTVTALLSARKVTGKGGN